jgi:hypothetical protein
LAVSLIARIIEEHGIATCVFAQDEDYAGLLIPPRMMVIKDTTLGFPLGRPGDREVQLRLVGRALEFIQNGSQPGEKRYYSLMT